MGIAPQDHGRIFEQFERTDDSRKRAPGLGLGLFITKQIVRLHGGEISLESGPGQGALFRVRLPWTAPPAGPTE
jgi:signal transduction histidine kinase